MAGFCPHDGRNFIVDLIANQGLELGLFTNATPDINLTAGTITEPTGGGYARQAIPYANFVTTGDDSVYNATKTFTVTGTDYSAPVLGYFITTVAAPKRLIQVTPDPALGSGVTFTVGSSYDIIPKLKVG